MFSEYLARQLSHRDQVYKYLGISKSTFYRHLKNPNEMTVGEFKQACLIGELDEQKVMDFIYRRIK